MAKRRKRRFARAADLRLNPEKRLCSQFDALSIKKFRMARPGEMGMRVVDNCAEEHMM